MKHNPELKPDPLSRESLIVWLMLQPVEGQYCYANPRSCLLGQWTRSIDENARHDACSSFGYKVNGEYVNLSHFKYIASGGDSGAWTYGAALRRAQH